MPNCNTGITTEHKDDTYYYKNSVYKTVSTQIDRMKRETNPF